MIAELQEHKLSVWATSCRPPAHRISVDLVVSDETFELMKEYEDAALHTGRLIARHLRAAMADPKFLEGPIAPETKEDE